VPTSGGLIPQQRAWQTGRMGGCAPKAASRKARSRCTDYAALICRLLQKLEGPVRRQVIETSIRQYERLALEACMRSQRKAKPACDEAREFKMVTDTPCDDFTDSHRSQTRRAKGSGGICKCTDAGKVYGYYAKVGLGNLTLRALIRRDLASAVCDHIVLMKVSERIRCQNACVDFPARVRSAVTSVLEEEGLLERSFLRNITVNVSAFYRLGRSLYVTRSSLEGALEAWKFLDAAKGDAIDRPAYSRQKAETRWQRVREAFIQLQVGSGACLRSQVEAYLVRMESLYRPLFERKVAYLQRRQWKNADTTPANAPASRDDIQTLVLRRLEQSLRRWRKDVLREARKRKRSEARTQRERAESMKRCLWDGKESRADFDRRVSGL